MHNCYDKYQKLDEWITKPIQKALRGDKQMPIKQKNWEKTKNTWTKN